MIRWRSRVRTAFIVVLAVCAVSALIEKILELRDAARLTASETFHEAHGRRIRYHLTGEGAARPTVVLINGALASLEQWNGVQNALAGVAPCLSYDRGGVGFSDSADAHDANGQADELAELLRTPAVAGPIVIVSFSSGSALATVFAARHRDIVKGIVYVDPASTPGTQSWRRIFWRVSVTAPVEAFFGYTRLRFAIASRNAPQPSALTARSDAILASTHHWLASAQDLMTLDESERQADAALATHPFTDLPVGLLTTADPGEGPDLRVMYERQLPLVASSARHFIRVVHSEHRVFLNDPAGIAAIVDLIRTVTDAARAGAP
jgi:pimeloyl-ACP methyl ester carboxylesterase